MNKLYARFDGEGMSLVDEEGLPVQLAPISVTVPVESAVFADGSVYPTPAQDEDEGIFGGEGE